VADDKEWLPKGAADEKGWWAAETEVEETEVEVKAGPVASVLLAMMVLVVIYLFYRMSTSDNLFVQVCFGILFW
jgi:hypothetical protein